MFRPTRSTDQDIFYYEIRVGLLLLAAGAGLIGMATERPVLVWLAIGFAAAGIVVRLIGARRNKQKHPD